MISSGRTIFGTVWIQRYACSSRSRRPSWSLNVKHPTSSTYTTLLMSLKPVWKCGSMRLTCVVETVRQYPNDKLVSECTPISTILSSRFTPLPLDWIHHVSLILCPSCKCSNRMKFVLRSTIFMFSNSLSSKNNVTVQFQFQVVRI